MTNEPKKTLKEMTLEELVEMTLEEVKEMALEEVKEMTNDKNDVYVKFAKNIPIALVCDGEKHSFQGLSETCVCGKEKANITRIEENEKEIK